MSFPSEQKKIRVLLADDHTILIEGLRRLLEPEFEIAGMAADGAEAVEMAAATTPQVAVLDIGMPRLNGIEAARQINLQSPSTKVIILTQQTSSLYVREAIASGVSGYVVKQSAANELKKAIDAVLQGGMYMSPSLVPPGSTLQELLHSLSSESEALTPRQVEVLQLVAQGRAMKEIATQLGISVKTVEFHKACLTERLGVHTTAELTQFAIHRGII
jgi:DNA-binding NarL/FixJ family response regulator